MKNYLPKFVYMLWLVLFPGLAFSSLNAGYTKASLNSSTWNPSGDTISPKIQTGLKKIGSSVPKKPEIILNLNANEGSVSSPGGIGRSEDNSEPGDKTKNGKPGYRFGCRHVQQQSRF